MTPTISPRAPEVPASAGPLFSSCLPLFAAFAVLALSACGSAPESAVAAERTKVVFLAGDDEYRSEESLPMLAKMLERDFGFETVVGFSVDEEGFVRPVEQGSLTMTEELADADLLVMYLRFRDLPEERFAHLLEYFESGRPLVAFRTTTHAFRFGHDPDLEGWGHQASPDNPNSYGGGELLRELLGQKWITHHGHFDDGKAPLTRVTVREGGGSHPVLRGVTGFDAYSWLYHVEGGGDTFAGDPDLLLDGESLKSNKVERGETERYPLVNPVAWTLVREGFDEGKGRVFTTTLGHPYDFRDAAMRRLSIQGMLWALGREDLIPEAGVGTDTVGPYEPNNSGARPDSFKQGMKPEDFTGE